MKDIRLNGLGIALIGVIVGMTSTAIASQIAWSSCPNDAPYPAGTLCASVPLPTSDDPWSPSVSGALEVFLAKYPAQGSEPRAQLWLLPGGPGNPGASFGHDFAAASKLLPDVDLIAIDPRGTGRSTFLECDPAKPDQDPDYVACAIRQASDPRLPLAAFSTFATAQDLNLLIGMERGRLRAAMPTAAVPVFVLGRSYGTYLAQRFAQLFPDQADGIILDSILPVDTDISRFRITDDEVLHGLAHRCDASSQCADRIGGDAWQFLRSTIDAVGPTHCGDLADTYARTPIRGLLSNLLSNVVGRDYLFPALYRLARCEPRDVSALKTFANQINNVVMGSAMAANSAEYNPFSELLSEQIWYTDLWPAQAISQRDIDALVKSTYSGVDISTDAAPGIRWPRGPHDARLDVYPSLSMPMLMMNGTLDPQTPYAAAAAAAAHFHGPDQTFVTVPDAPHCIIDQTPTIDPSAPTCGLQMVASFVRNPTGPVDTSCLHSLRPISYVGDPALTKVLFGTADLWD